MSQPKEMIFIPAGLILLAIGVWAAFSVWGTDSLFKPARPSPKYSLTFCVGRQPTAALVLLAHDKGFFEDEGLDLTLKESVSGRRALEEMFKTGAEMGSAADVAVVQESLLRDDFKILAVICEGLNIPKIVARTDRGIKSPEDLRGKKIGTQGKSSLHFFLHTFLAKYGMGPGDVRLSLMDLEQIPDALVYGTVDAVSIREPWLGQIRERLGANYKVFEEPGLYTMLELLIVRDDFLKRNPEAVVRVVKALLRAEAFIRQNPKEAETILSRHFNVDLQPGDGILHSLSCEVFLDQSLFHYMESQARWLIEDGFAKGAKLPDFLEKVDPAPLEAVKKDRVRIVKLAGQGKVKAP